MLINNIFYIVAYPKSQLFHFKPIRIRERQNKWKKEIILQGRGMCCVFLCFCFSLCLMNRLNQTESTISWFWFILYFQRILISEYFLLWSWPGTSKLTLVQGIDLFNGIVFIRATDHVIPMLCHVTKIVDGKNISGSIDTNPILILLG